MALIAAFVLTQQHLPFQCIAFVCVSVLIEAALMKGCFGSMLQLNVDLFLLLQWDHDDNAALLALSPDLVLFVGTSPGLQQVLLNGIAHSLGRLHANRQGSSPEHASSAHGGHMQHFGLAC